MDYIDYAHGFSGFPKRENHKRGQARTDFGGPALQPWVFESLLQAFLGMGKTGNSDGASCQGQPNISWLCLSFFPAAFGSPTDFR